jgi:hypothetical protein
MWIICHRGMARDMIDTNNLIEAFHHKLKYTYMRSRPGHQLDGEIYIRKLNVHKNVRCFMPAQISVNHVSL